MSPYIFIFSDLLKDRKVRYTKSWHENNVWSKLLVKLEYEPYNCICVISLSEWIIFVNFPLDIGDSLDLCFPDWSWMLSQLRCFLALTDLLHLLTAALTALWAAGTLRQVSAPSPLLLLAVSTGLRAVRLRQRERGLGLGLYSLSLTGKVGTRVRKMEAKKLKSYKNKKHWKWTPQTHPYLFFTPSLP